MSATTTVPTLGLGRRLLGVGLAASFVAAGAYAYTAGNSVPDTRAGDGAGGVSGYVVSAVNYTLATDPQTIDGVSFSLDAPASTVRASIDGTNWATCTNTAGTDWDCDLVDAAVASVGSLSVVATS